MTVVDLLGGHAVLAALDEACEMLRRVLKGCEANVETATSSRDALRRLRTTKHDILVSDIGMPEMYGYELIRALRSRGLTIPAAALPNSRISCASARISAAFRCSALR
jgi:CheY-like chemotaxis protein